MIYLIAHQFWFLVLAFAFAALAGWAWAGMRAQPQLDTVVRDRERLMRDLLAASGENGAAPSAELERQMDALKLRADMAQARATELERTAEAARARAEEAAGRAAELERTLERKDSDAEELVRLRTENAAHAEQQRQTLDVVAAPEPAPVASTEASEEAAAQGWRLRYFEQRVRYLENQAKAVTAPAAAPSAVDNETPALQLEWRARLAEARARHLEQDARAHEAPVAAPSAAVVEPLAEPVAPAVSEEPNWRAQYLEKRVQHLRAQPAPVAATAPSTEPDEAERAKWRTRYLESRIRHLEAALQAPPTTPTAAPPQTPPAVTPLRAARLGMASPPTEPVEAEPEALPLPPAPTGAEERPAALPAAQSGAPDDLSLIEGVSLLQHSTLNALGIYHFDQIAAWTPANVAWVDQYLRLRGRITGENWIGQAERLAREGPEAARLMQDENA